MTDIIRIYVGYDPVEAIAYHTCCESIIRNSSRPVSITPLYLPHFKGEYNETHKGSNQFIHSRFLIPYLENYQGSAIFMDGDMTVEGDIAKLWELKDPYYAVQCVKHSYTTKYPVKYLGASNIDYPRKNWSSVMIFNNSNYLNRKLTPEYVMNQEGKELHRFGWLTEDRIGELPKEWNHLCMEYPANEEANLYHWTVGTPCFIKDEALDYKNQDHAEKWFKHYSTAVYPMLPTKESLR